MRRYEVSVPITGFQVIRIVAKNRKEAVEAIKSGEYDHNDCDSDIELDPNTCNWEIN